jgi:hypothetical protein
MELSLVQVEVAEQVEKTVHLAQAELMELVQTEQVVKVVQVE